MSPSRDTTVTGCPSHSAVVRVCHARAVAPGSTSMTIGGNDLREPMHHDFAPGQSRGGRRASHESGGREGLHDLRDGVRRGEKIDIDGRPRVREDGHRDAPTDGVRDPRASERDHHTSKLLEEIQRDALVTATVMSSGTTRRRSPVKRLYLGGQTEYIPWGSSRESQRKTWAARDRRPS
jgi:hypothetical protein